MKRAHFLLLVAVVALAQPVGVTPQGPPPGVPSTSTSSRIYSPTVVGTTMITTLDGVSSLSFMVLWRGTDGWFLKPGPRSGGGGSRMGIVTERVSYGGVNLVAEFQLLPRSVRIQGNDVPLSPADANVVLVDRVDSEALKIVSTLKIDPAMTTNREIEPLLKQSPQLVSFLQCDHQVPNPAPAVKAAVEIICQRIAGK